MHRAAQRKLSHSALATIIAYFLIPKYSFAQVTVDNALGKMWGNDYQRNVNDLVEEANRLGILFPP